MPAVEAAVSVDRQAGSYECRQCAACPRRTGMQEGGQHGQAEEGGVVSAREDLGG